jgi:hypothetical protein
MVHFSRRAIANLSVKMLVYMGLRDNFINLDDLPNVIAAAAGLVRDNIA